MSENVLQEDISLLHRLEYLSFLRLRDNVISSVFFYFSCLIFLFSPFCSMLMTNSYWINNLNLTDMYISWKVKVFFFGLGANIWQKILRLTLKISFYLPCHLFELPVKELLSKDGVSFFSVSCCYSLFSACLGCTFTWQSKEEVRPDINSIYTRIGRTQYLIKVKIF